VSNIAVMIEEAIEPPLARMAGTLAQRAAEGKLRQLRLGSQGVDFSTNDYLGLARDKALHQQVLESWAAYIDSPTNGATASRLLGGESVLAEETEADISRFHQAESALLFATGYMANQGLLSCVANRGETILYDAYVHASLREGLRLSLATTLSFHHNDLEHLREQLARAKGQVYVATESVFSMDGDTALLAEIATLCREFGAKLILDEAHALGVLGQKGEGLWTTDLEDVTLARVYTFGKGLGCHGAAVVGSNILKLYLINYCRPFIYSTALAPVQMLAIRHAYPMMAAADDARTQIRTLAAALNEGLKDLKVEGFLADYCPAQASIAAIIQPGNTEVRALAATLQAAGFDVRPVVSPTVQAGTERIRICLHSYNTLGEVEKLLSTLRANYAKATRPL
jgi:8-amino-7-oxononanoate synthase